MTDWLLGAILLVLIFMMMSVDHEDSGAVLKELRGLRSDIDDLKDELSRHLETITDQTKQPEENPDDWPE